MPTVNSLSGLHGRARILKSYVAADRLRTGNARLPQRLFHRGLVATQKRGVHAGASDAAAFAQELAGHGSRGDTSDGLACRGAAAAGHGTDAVLGLSGPVGVRRPVHVLQVVVGAGVLVLVADQQCDRRTNGPALVDAREDLDPIGLLALGDMT